MSCHNCGEKQNRYNIPTVSSVETSDEKRDEQFTGKVSALDPEALFNKARTMSYIDLDRQRTLQKKEILNQTERTISLMTPAMKQMHVEELVAAFNGEEIIASGITATHALRSLNKLLNREDFSAVNEVYPKLKPLVAAKIEELEKNKLLLK